MTRLFCVLLMGMAASLSAQTTEVEDPSDLKRVIEHDLADDGIEGVEIDVRDGTVLLTGQVSSAWEKRRAAELALRHNEVVSVENEITVSGDRADERLAGDVARQLRNYVHYTIFDNVDVHANEGVVTLTGKVTWGYKAEEMAKMASRVPGVQKVVNEIEVLPNSPNDDQIRAAVASRIYDDPLFTSYAIQAVPPIHIVVENGRVTLTGVVDTPIQKRKAEQIARHTFGVFSVENQLRVSSSSS